MRRSSRTRGRAEGRPRESRGPRGPRSPPLTAWTTGRGDVFLTARGGPGAGKNHVTSRKQR
jgi:hypothetical protein